MRDCPLGPKVGHDVGAGMKALFITTQTNDTHNLVDAWDSVVNESAARFMFHYERDPVDDSIIEAAKKTNPEIIFYIGGCDGNTTIGFPTVGTFRKLRKIAPIVNLIPDAGDFGSPWPAQIERYRTEECFDLHVGLDGCLNSPVDHVTVTPVNCRPFETTVEKDIRCGFSGGIGGKRDSILEALGSRCTIRIRNSISGNYDEHAHFSQRCHIILNTAWTGSGQYYHIKGRVLEAGWAKSALLEQIHSPIKDWFPSDSYFSYADTGEAIRVIETTSDDAIRERAMRLAQVVRENYHPMKIYQGILDKLGAGHTL